MEILDKTPAIIGYAIIKAEDGSVEEIKGSSASPLGDLTAYFSSAGDVMVNSLSLGILNYVSLGYGSNRLVIFLYGAKFFGLEIERDTAPLEFIAQIRSAMDAALKPKFELPHSIISKVQQINLLVDEFGSPDNKTHWQDLLSQGLAILGGEILLYIGIVEGQLTFTDKPPEDKENDFVQGLRAIIDFLVKKGVLEMGSAQARGKVQAVIERMK